MRLFKLAVNHIVRDPHWSGLFLIVIFTSNFGFLTVHGLRESVELNVRDKIKNSIGSDIVISSRQQISDTTISKILEISKPEASTQMFEFFAMLSSKTESKLVLVRAVQDNYPLYGFIKDELNHLVSFSNLESQIVIESTLASSWGLKYPDELYLGDKKFLVSKQVIQSDPTQSFRLGNLAPRVYIALPLLQSTNLITPESTYTHSILLKLPKLSDPKIIKQKILENLNTLELDISTPEDASLQLSGPIRVIGDFLSLIGLGSIIFANIAFYFLSQLYFFRRLPNITVFQILGLNLKKCFWYASIELGIIAVIATLISLVASYIAIPPLTSIMFKELNLEQLSVNLTEAMVISLSNIAFVILVFFGPQIYLLNLKSAFKSFNFSAEYENKISMNHRFVITVLSLIWIIILALLIAPSVRLISSYILSISILSGLAIGMSYFILFWLQKAQLPVLFKLSIKRFKRAPKIFITTVTIITICSSLIFTSLILSSFIKRDLLSASEEKPSLFLFDISDEDMPSLLRFLETQNIKPLGVSPLIRGRILQVNGEKFEKDLESSKLTREQEIEARFRNRGLNITIRDQISSSEVITSYLKNRAPHLMPLSIEQRFAERIGVKLGDRIKLDIQGREFDCEVTELRSIRWNSFLPNFFVQTKTGFIDESPKIWLMGIPNISTAKKNALIRLLAQKFSSLTVLDVEQIINQLADWTQEFSRILAITSFSQLVVGFLVIFIMIALEIQSRKSEFNLYYFLGFSKATITSQKYFEVAVMLLISLSLSLLFSYLISKFLVTLLLSW